MGFCASTFATLHCQRSRRALEARVETRAAGNMPAGRRPEFLQLCGFITVLISPIQLSFDSFDFVLLWQRHSIIDVGRNLIARPGERDSCVEIEAALLQLSRAPILVGGATMSPYIRCVSIPGIRIPAGHGRARRRRGLVCATNQP